jgi:hypothetical protein
MQIWQGLAVLPSHGNGFASRCNRPADFYRKYHFLMFTISYKCGGDRPWPGAGGG